jgi:hypothetical protein
LCELVGQKCLGSVAFLNTSNDLSLSQYFGIFVFLDGVQFALFNNQETTMKTLFLQRTNFGRAAAHLMEAGVDPCASKGDDGR